MAVNYESNNVTAIASTNSLGLTVPTGTTTGNLLLAQIIHTNTQTVTPPSGYTLVLATTVGVQYQSTYYKIAVSGDTPGSTHTFSMSATSLCGGGLTRYSGTNTNTPIFESASGSGGAPTNTPSFSNTITNHMPDSMIVIHARGAGGFITGMGSYAVVTSNPTWTEIYDSNYTNTIDFSSAHGLRTATTATGNSSLVSTGDPAEFICHLIAIAPPLITTTTDTVTETDSLRYSMSMFPTDTITETDTVTAERSKTWVTQNKNTSTWVNPDKT